ncbi:hypothetical protein BX265_6198 [Streptomyces sp. TLI_235]|nr:hypothetical protein [Streptomyces sp. TLI_235]PBC71588.1 hypothetical protein BX265_6198 [Streptomyces sp. TLI_235]
MATYPSIAAGQRITGSLLTSMLPLEAWKMGDTPRDTTTTTTADPDLALSVEATATYRLAGMLAYGVRSDTDLKFGFSAPASSTLVWHGHCQATGTAGTTGSAIFDVQSIGTTSYAPGGAAADNTTIMVVVLHGLLTTSITAGTFSLNWAQNTSNAVAAILKAGSHLTLKRIN